MGRNHKLWVALRRNKNGRFLVLLGKDKGDKDDLHSRWRASKGIVEIDEGSV